MRSAALEELRAVFGDRLKPAPPPGDALVLPRDAGEVETLAAVANRHALALNPLGAGTLPGPENGGSENGGVLVRFDLMGAVRPPERGEASIWAEPGATLLSLENNLSTRGLGLAVYPTSAPRATVGGWLAGESIGVGSFEYGRLTENVLSANLVLGGGGRKTVPGEELPKVLQTSLGGLVVGAQLRTRTARDTPFAARFDDPGDLVDAAASLHERGVPLWHLAFLDAAMSRDRGLGEEPLLFGAYPTERSSAVEEALDAAVKEHGGRALFPADAHGVWGQRFSPVAPSRPVPEVRREISPLADVPAVLRSEERPVQGTVSRSGEVLLLTFTDGPR